MSGMSPTKMFSATVKLGTISGSWWITRIPAAWLSRGSLKTMGVPPWLTTPLSGLNKRRVRAVGERLGADPETTGKVPTADLETNNPGVPDEAVLGVTYDEIDDFLEGRDVDESAAAKIIATHRRTAHKRAVPLAFS